MKPIKLSIYLTMFVLLVFSVAGANCGDGVGACACGDTVVADYTYPGNVQYNCTGTGLIIGSVGIIINLNGSQITDSNGGSDYGINGNFNDGFIIANGTVKDFDNGIYLSGADHTQFYNMTLIDNVNYGFRLRSTNVTIANSLIYRTTKQETDTGYAIKTDSSLAKTNHKIINNEIYNYYYLINLVGLTYTRNINISHNYLHDSGSSIIRMAATHNSTYIGYNNFVNAGWNAVDLCSPDVIVEYNNFSNSTHGDVDAFCGYVNSSFNAKVRYNNMFSSEDSTSALYVVDSVGLNYYNNTHYNKTIGIDGQNASNTLVNNNVFYGQRHLGNIFLCSGINNTFKDNDVFSNNYNYSGYSSQYLSPLVDCYFLNNTYSSIPKYKLENGFVNTTINESSNYNIIEIAGGGTWTDTDGTFEAKINNFTLTRYCDSNSQGYDIGSGEEWALYGCVTGGEFPQENANYITDTTFHYGKYYLDDPENDGVLNPEANDITLDGSNSEIIGTTNQFIKMNGGFDRITIKNFKLKGFEYGVWLYTGTNDIHVINNTFENVGRGAYTYNTQTGILIENNTFINSSTRVEASVTDWDIKNNLFNCPNQLCGDDRGAVVLRLVDNTIVNGNTFKNAEYGVYAYSNSTGHNITNNIFRELDRGLRLSASDPDQTTTVSENYFINNTNDYDQYTIDIELINVTKVNIYNNYINESTDMSIIMQRANNIVIANNSFDMVNITERSNYEGNGQNEPVTAIKCGLYKTFNYLVSYPYGVDGSEVIRCYNITVLDNIFDSDTSVYFRGQGTYNLVQDFTNVRNISFRTTELTQNDTLFINNIWDMLNNSIRWYSPNDNTKSFYIGHSNDPEVFWGHNVNEGNLATYFKNTNSTINYNVSYSCPSDYETYALDYNDIWGLGACSPGCTFPVKNVNTISEFCLGRYPPIINMSRDSSILSYNMSSSSNMTFLTNLTTNLYSIFSLSNSGTLKWLGSGSKYLTVQNTTVKAQTSAPNSICPPDSATCVQDFEGQYNKTIGSGERMFIVSMGASTYPRLNTVPLTITDLTYSVSGNTLTYSQTGTGDTVLDNLNAFKQPNPFTLVRKNTVPLTRVDGDSYTVKTTDTYTLAGTSSAPLKLNSTIAYTILTTIVTIMFIFGLLLMIIFPIVNRENLNWDAKRYIMYYFSIIIGVTLVRVVVQYVFNS